MSTTGVQKIDLSAEILAALLWQHNNAAKLTAIIQHKQAWINSEHSQFWSDWAKDVFDLRTANAFGLQVWGIILGVPISIGENAEAADRPAWGFGEYNQNFNNGNFLPASGSVNNLDIEDARLLLRLRYFSLICRPCTWQINRFLERVYPEITCRDTTDMSAIIYEFKRPMSPALMSLMLERDVLPRPATVGIAVNVMGRRVFGFGEFNENFNNGTFISA